MTPFKTRDPNLIRYSPRPLESYQTGEPGSRYGPATSTLLSRQEAWNLAYLSFDYEEALQPLDAHFTVHVRRTCQTRLDGNGIELVASDDRILVSSWLRLPAPRFVHLIKAHKHLRDIPMYVAYGDQWVSTIEHRAHLCQTHEDPPDNVVDFSAARALLEAIRNK
jgi:hypothetical protein